MNREQIQGNWLMLKGKVKEKWGELTDDELDVAEGHLDQLAGAIAKRYGMAKEEAHRQLEELFENETCSS